jgi:hypothetical protein
MAMAQPLLDFLEGRARVALPFLRAAATAGVKVTAVIDVLRAFGLKFATQPILDIYAALQGRADIKRYLRIVPLTTTLPSEAHKANVVYNQIANYNYVIRVFHPDTMGTQYVVVASAVPLSQLQIRAKVDAMFATGERYKLTLEEYADSEVTIEEANRRLGI